MMWWVLGYVLSVVAILVLIYGANTLQEKAKKK